MKYRLRSLLIFATLMPPLLAGFVFVIRSAVPGPAILLVPAQGIVRLNGVPCDKVGVIYIFDYGDSAEGVTDKSGAFDMTYHEWKGCPPRKAKVLVVNQIPGKLPLPGKGPPGTILACPRPPPLFVNPLPSRYGMLQTTPLAVEVVKGTTNHFVIDLTEP